MSLEDGNYSSTKLLKLSSIPCMDGNVVESVTTKILALVASFDSDKNKPDVLIYAIQDIICEHDRMSIARALEHIITVSKWSANDIDDSCDSCDGCDGLDAICYNLDGYTCDRAIEALVKVKDRFRKIDKLRDNCEVCHGERGGVRGNENVIDGKVMCDYCSSDTWKNSKNKVNDF